MRTSGREEGKRGRIVIMNCEGLYKHENWGFPLIVCERTGGSPFIKEEGRGI